MGREKSERIYKRFLFAVCLGLLSFLTVACGEKEQTQDGKTYEIYYVNNDETKIVSRAYVGMAEDDETVLAQLMEELGKNPEKMEYKATLSNDFSLLSYTLENGQLTMNFDERYRSMEKTKEVLVRAAIVRTLTQAPDVQYVSFTVQGEQLTDISGLAVGMMASDTFIENTGNEINTYEKVNLRLYFANESGDLLVEENQRNVVYNSNIALEKLVVEKLVAGPQSQEAYPAINPATKIISVTVQDGICYVNLSEDFLSPTNNVTSDVTIYSLINSLVELSNVNKVQISINGETNVSYREKFSLNTVFERNLDLLASRSSN